MCGEREPRQRYGYGVAHWLFKNQLGLDLKMRSRARKSRDVFVLVCWLGACPPKKDDREQQIRRTLWHYFGRNVTGRGVDNGKQKETQLAERTNYQQRAIDYTLKGEPRVHTTKQPNDKCDLRSVIAWARNR